MAWSLCISTEAVMTAILDWILIETKMAAILYYHTTEATVTGMLPSVLLTQRDENNKKKKLKK